MNWERLKSFLPLVAGILIVGVAVYSLDQLLAQIRYHDIIHELHAQSFNQIALALVFVVLSFAALALTEILSLWLAGIPQPAARAALVCFLSQSIVHTTGFGLILGASLRYWLYEPYGLKMPDVARSQFFFSFGFFLATLVLLAGTVVLAPDQMALHIGGSADLWQALGGELIILLLVLMGWSYNGKSLSVATRVFTPPPLKTSLPLVVLSAADLLACCGVIYILLPAGLDLTYPTVLVAFIAAIAVSLVSHVPGGLGVFEATILVLISPPAELTAATVGALLMFRTLYYLLPFLISSFLLGVRVRSYVRKAGQIIAPLAPKTSAVLALVAGALLIFSNATPIEHARLRLLGEWLPTNLIEVSHLTASVVGVILLVVAHGLSQRLRAAWLLAVVLCGGGAVLALLKGLELGVALVLVAILLILLPTRKAFYRPSSLLSERLTPEWWVMILMVLASTIWLLLFGYKHVQYRQELWWQVELHAEAARSLRAALAVAITVLILGVRALLQPAKLVPPLPTVAELDQFAEFLKTCPSHQGWIGLTGDKHFLWNAQRTALLLYGVEGRSWVALGEPIGPPEEWSNLLWDFMTLVDAHGGRAAFYQVNGDNLMYFVDLGLHPFKLGEAALVPLETFSLQGGARSDLRASCNKVEKAGGSFEIATATGNTALLDELEEISNRWLSRHNVREKRFSLGFFDRSYLERTPLALVRRNGVVVAFANLWAGKAADGILSVDLMRYSDDAPSGTMDYLLTHVLLWGKAQGFRYFDLGMAPLTGLPLHHLAGNWVQIARLVANHGKRFYNFEGLRAYKEKFSPVWQASYLMCRPSQLVSVLLDIGALISGSVSGLVKK